MTDLTLARYLMALLLVVAAIPVLAQAVSGNQAAGNKGGSESVRSIRQDVEAAVRRLSAADAVKATATAGAKAEGTKAAEKEAAKATENEAKNSAENQDAAEQSKPGVRRADLREWRLKHDEKRSQQVRS